MNTAVVLSDHPQVHRLQIVLFEPAGWLMSSLDQFEWKSEANFSSFGDHAPSAHIDVKTELSFGQGNGGVALDSRDLASDPTSTSLKERNDPTYKNPFYYVHRIVCSHRHNTMVVGATGYSRLHSSTFPVFQQCPASPLEKTVPRNDIFPQNSC